MDALFGLTRILAVALGIGVVIFVHELGHFLAARWCQVRVEVFSIGFGPALLSWRRGATLYKLAAIPLGGYVKMAGDEGVPEGAEPAPDLLPAKSVGQRFFIYSGGVLMNLLFAVAVFPILFAVGVPFLQPVLGDPRPGGPAWDAGLTAGTRVLAVNGNHVYDFGHIPTEVALGGETAELEVLEPGAERPRTVTVVPEYDERIGMYSIQVGPGIDPERRIDVAPGSPAWEAGLRPGDRLVGLPDGAPGLGFEDQINLLYREGQPLTVAVEGPEGVRTATIEPRLRTEGVPPRIGIQPPYRHVTGVRATPLTRGLGLREGDRIQAVDGRELWRAGDLWKRLSEGGGRRVLRVERDGEVLELETPPFEERDEVAAFVGAIALQSDVESTVLVVEPDSPAARAGIRDGDRVTQLDSYPATDWEDVQAGVRAAAAEGRAVELLLERVENGAVSYERPVVTAEPIPVPDYGLALELAGYVYRVDSPLEALRVGVACSWKLVEDSWFTLKSILFTNRVSGDNVGGIITIGAVSYHWAESGLAKLLFFLCMLSVNVAFINVLPIPVLDGGHLFFLLVEKLKGSPVSERVLGYSQMVGLVLILSLMVYVTFNDIARWFFPQ